MPTGVYERTTEHRKKMSKSAMGNKRAVGNLPNKTSFKKGHKLSEEHKKTLSIVHKGNKHALGDPPNKTSFKKGQASWNKGKKASKETIEKLRKSHLGQTAWNKGKELSPEHIKHMSESHLGIHCGEDHWNWQGGLSLEPYGDGWTDTLKEEIRERDGRRCQLCGAPEFLFDTKLDVHHIDYGKVDHRKLNLIALCHKCHLGTRRRKVFWQRYFMIKLALKTLRALSAAKAMGT